MISRFKIPLLRLNRKCSLRFSRFHITLRHIYSTTHHRKKVKKRKRRKMVEGTELRSVHHSLSEKLILLHFQYRHDRIAGSRARFENSRYAFSRD